MRVVVYILPFLLSMFILPSAAAEALNECDKLVEQADPANGECRDAMPPLHAGDGLGRRTSYYINPQHVTVNVLRHPNRPLILDRDGNDALVVGEALEVAVLFFAKDERTLNLALRHTEIQAFRNGEWQSKRNLNSTDFGKRSNKRRYHFSLCGKQFQRFHRLWKEAQKMDLLAYSGLGRKEGVGGEQCLVGRAILSGGHAGFTTAGPGDTTASSGPRGPETIAGGLGSSTSPGSAGRPVPDGDPTCPMPGPDRQSGGKGLVPLPDDSEERILQEMRDASMKKAVEALEAAIADRPGECPDKTLPYYWTAVYFQHSPDVGEERLRLFVNSTLSGDKIVNLPTTKPYKVYAAVGAGFKRPEADGQRDYSFQVFSSNLFTLDGNMGVVFNEEGSFISDRTSASIGSDIDEVVINGRQVRHLLVNGHFPFRKSYWDEAELKEIWEIASVEGDFHLRALEGGAPVSYHIEIGSFQSPQDGFTMPLPLTFALMGDSYSSGQGAPLQLSNAHYEGWINDACHRSRASGLYRAMNQFIKLSRKAVDYIFVACEGAVIQDLVDRAQEADGQLKQAKAQVDLVKDWMEGRYTKLNGALFSIGGNNIQFAPIVGKAMITPTKYFDLYLKSISLGYLFATTVAEHGLPIAVDNGFAYLPNRYAEVNTALTDELHVDNVLILNYPDLTHNESGGNCTSDCPASAPFKTFEQSEFDYGSSVLSRLNTAVADAAATYNWDLADIFEATRNRGICVCNNIVFTTWTAATNEIGGLCSRGLGAMPLGKSCSFHPNARGYGLYVTPILEALNNWYGG